MMSSPVILITGASSGIGAATARLFGARGYRVILTARRQERLESLVAGIRENGGDACSIPADISQPEQIERMVKRALDCFGQIDILVNNAGLGRLNWLENLDPQDDIAYQIQVNLTGMIQTTRMVLPQMLARNSGTIINIGSIAGLVATPAYSVYAATKYGVRGFTEALRREVSVYGIEVAGIYPGSVVTEFGQKAKLRRKTGVGTPKALKLMADDVAQTIWSVVERPRRAVITPWQMRPVVWASVVFPGLVDRIIEWRFTNKERE